MPDVIDSRRLWSDGDMGSIVGYWEAGVRRSQFEEFTGISGLSDAAISAEVGSWPTSRLRAMFDGIAVRNEAAVRLFYGLGPGDPIPDFARGAGPGVAEELLGPFRLSR